MSKTFHLSDAAKNWQVDPTAPLEKQTATLRNLVAHPPVNSRHIVFDPKLAAYVLNPTNAFWQKNRPLRPLKIRRYAEAMTQGKWLLTGETIKFGLSGKLLDGYHRLTACVRSNTQFETDVKFGINDASFHAMDTGGMRGANDVLSIAGYSRSSVRAAATRWWLILTSEHPDNRTLDVTNETILETHEALNADPLFEEALLLADRMYRKSKYFTMGAMLALLFIYIQRNPQAVVKFVNDAAAGKGDAEKLRQRLHEIAASNLGRLHENTRNARAVLTLNAYCTGVRLPKTRHEPFWDTQTTFPEFEFDKKASR